MRAEQAQMAQLIRSQQETIARLSQNPPQQGKPEGPAAIARLACRGGAAGTTHARR